MNKYIQILPPEERYCMPTLNEIRFISENQSMSLVMGSCISTVFLGKSDKFILAANHIVIATPRVDSKVATKSAEEQIDEIFSIYKEAYQISEKNLICLHLIGAGSKLPDCDSQIHLENIEETRDILKAKKITPIFNDTKSFFVGMYSIKGSQLSVFVSNKINNTSVSFIVNLESLFNISRDDYTNLPASTLLPNNEGFEHLIKNNVVETITGQKSRIGN